MGRLQDNFSFISQIAFQPISIHFRLSRMRTICFVVLVLEILKEAQSLKCHVNEEGKDPVPTDCKVDEVCGHTVNEMEGGAVGRTCMTKEMLKAAKVEAGKCMQMEGMTTVCACATDNCNHECTAESCKDMGPSARQMNVTVPKPKICDANCKAPGGGSGNDDQKPTGDDGVATAAPNGDGSKGTGNGGDGAAATGDGGDGTSATGDGIQRVADSKKFVLAFWILTTLVTFILTH